MKRREQFLRFTANGLVAAGVHFSLLFCFLKVLGFSSAGASNLLAAIGGVSVSFIGNRHFVFRAASRPVLGQAGKFLLLYSATTLMHGLVLLGWTDLAGQDYRVGFLIATGLQFVMSFLGNRFVVFKD